jgi:hypothetical protein
MLSPADWRLLTRNDILLSRWLHNGPKKPEVVFDRTVKIATGIFHKNDPSNAQGVAAKNWENAFIRENPSNRERAFKWGDASAKEIIPRIQETVF